MFFFAYVKMESVDEKFSCECGKTFTTKRWLTNHKEKNKVPCDLKCRICSEVSKSKKLFKKHMKTIHKDFEAAPRKPPRKQPAIATARDALDDKGKEEAALKEDSDEEIEELVPISPTSGTPIPMEDFNIDILRLIHSMPTEELLKIPGTTVEYTKERAQSFHTYYQPLGSVARDNLKLTVERERVVVPRTMEALQALTNAMMCRTMRSMDDKREMNSMKLDAQDMMYDLLHQQEHPELHNMCLSDTRRGTVKMFQRGSDANDDAQPQWVVHQKNDAMVAINAHARNLFSFMLEAGTQALKSAMWIDLNHECTPCLALSNMRSVAYCIIFYVYDSERRLRVDWKPSQVVSFNRERNASDDKLFHLIQTRKEEVLRQLCDLILEHKDLEECLRRSRAFGLRTMQSTL